MRWKHDLNCRIWLSHHHFFFVTHKSVFCADLKFSLRLSFTTRFVTVFFLVRLSKKKNSTKKWILDEKWEKEERKKIKIKENKGYESLSRKKCKIEVKSRKKIRTQNHKNSPKIDWKNWNKNPNESGDLNAHQTIHCK